jgi:hypothetical protein
MKISEKFAAEFGQRFTKDVAELDATNIQNEMHDRGFSIAAALYVAMAITMAQVAIRGELDD